MRLPSYKKDDHIRHVKPSPQYATGGGFANPRSPELQTCCRYAILGSMSQSFTAQLCRIVPPEKLTDRFLVSGLLQQPDNSNTDSQVILTYIFEVSQPWFPSSQVIPKLVEILTTQHIQLKPDGTLGNQFELLLRNLNEQLNAISESGETDWIGNFNGLVLVVGGEELHFAQTGHCPAYLLQNNRIRQITEDASPDHDTHPLKTFANLASGVLQDGDHILFANQELYKEVSLDALRRILNSTSPYQASQAIAKELKREKNPAVASCIIRLSTQGQIDPTVAKEPTEILLEEELQSRSRKIQKRLQPLWEIIKHLARRTGDASKKAAQQTSQVVTTTVAPKASELLQKGLEQAKQLKDQVSEKMVSKESPRNEPVVEQIGPKHALPVTPAQEVTQPIEEPPEALEEQPRISAVIELIPPKEERDRNQLIAKAEAAVEEKYAPPSDMFGDEPESIIPQDELALDSSVQIGLMSTEPNAKPKPMEAIRALLKPARNRRRAVLGIAALLLTIGIGVAIAKRKPVATQEALNQNAQNLKQATDLKNKATSAIALSQEIEASREIEQGLQLLDSLKSPSTTQQTEADTLWTALTAQADTLTKTTRFQSVTTQYSFTTTPVGMFANLPFFYGYASNGTGLLRTGAGETTQTQTSIALPGTNDAIVSIIQSNETDTAGYLLTRQKKVYRIVQSDNQTSLSAIAPSTGDFAYGDVIGTYNSNVYILDGQSGLLWKYANTGTVYNKGVSVIDSTKYDIKKTLSLAIDGSIYILKADGSLLKFTSGQSDTDFSLKDMPYLAQKMIKPLQVVTDDSMQSIYLLDAGLSSNEHSSAHILEFNKNGVYVRQYAFPKDMTNIKAFDINPKDKKLWVLNDSTVSEFSF